MKFSFEEKIKRIEKAPKEMQTMVAKAFIREDIADEDIQYLFNKDSIEEMNEDLNIDNVDAELPEGIGADGFTMRTTKPSNNKNFITTGSGGWNTCIKGYPKDPNADVLANCVGYASGRFNEIINIARDSQGCTYKNLNCNAVNFIERAKQNGLEVGSEPRLGAIGVMGGGSSGAGHVFVVERKDSNFQVYTSESAYSGTAFYNKLRNNSNSRWGMGSNYYFRGFIYLPSDVQKKIDKNPTPPTPSGDETKRNIQRTLNSRYGTGLAVDGIYGSQTHKALVKGLQKELNTQYGANLSVDGIFGPATKSKCPSVRICAKGNITYLIQAQLYCKGYSTNGVDGIFGNGTKTAIIRFQTNNGLTQDGVVGKNTFEKLFK